MKNIYSALLLLLASTFVQAQADRVTILENSNGMKLVVNDKDFMINGMNWDYFPVGTNFSYSLWNQPDDIIKAALDREMSMLKNMGVNTIRQYTGVPARWIQYIYENYGIYTMLNHSFGRYGLTIDGVWMANTEYSDPRVRELLLAEVTQMVNDYKDTPGLLMYLLGNENNYGLFWGGAETEDIPIEDRKSTERARAMYKLFNEATLAMKGMDTSHPIAMCNGDVLFIEIIKEECPDIDIYGTNMYRGISFGDAFQVVKDQLNKPIMFTEFGADAFNAKENQEDQESQAYYMLGNWKEIYENAYGLGKVGNSIGGFTFQFSDGWWKFGQTKNLDVHDNNASWVGGGYTIDLVEGENNMNEEWFGICAKGQTSPRGLYELYPRAAYYALKDAHTFDPFAQGVTLGTLEDHFSSIQLMDAVLRARGDKAAMIGERGSLVGISELRAEFSTYNTGGKLITTPDQPDPNNPTIPNQLGFDHMESFFVGVEANPAANVHANVTFNILGNVAQNPINEIFYENRGRPLAVTTPTGNAVLDALGRLQVYQAEYSWNNKYFNLTGFYRTGHYHWGYEGDFFGLYPEANYGPNIDIYNGLAPQGLEIEGKKMLEGLKVAYGRELWWGANPAVLLKYTREVGNFNFSGMFHEDLEEPGVAVSSIAVPQPRTRRASLAVETSLGKLKVQAGGIWGGQPLVGREFQFTRGSDGDYEIFVDKIQSSDTWGGKIKLSYSAGKINWYAQAASMGLVANGGGDYTQTFTGWRLKDSGSGNQNNFLTGFTYSVGNWQIAPNFLWQKPLVDPMPGDVQNPGRLRNILDDPFVVRNNRETVAGELLLTFDPTPGTWMYEWDNDRAEDSRFAASIGVVYRHLPTSQDAAVIFPGTGRVPVAADGAPPALDLWEVNARIVSKINPELGIIANLYGGNGQANGPDTRTVERYGGEVRVIYKTMKLTSHLKFNDWGPFDYHRDFNLTFPLQVMADISTSIAKQDWFILPSTTLGLRFTWRSLNEYSPRYLPNATANEFANAPIVSPVGFPNGNEWEIRTYVNINIGK
ncbi:glycoside hydrolase family 2 TIM barrel-domain containing protein [Fulvivirga sedimenti]|uniref:Glycosidase n=1 Tax=Fulvivirga sedimenti TaxID=2879465 RepID=A0A9X1HQ00_9BACT|nr:glycoside hydrolase family 2 TIM barrel-domain containing protein [Fulvivirga sedimenti]MCA6074654.1 glycosidase [Fulvivirga sedimenti]MCA6075831.1 glycosidase [Fulvivirga sedimenti]MCA6076959.1 glycosidase [Fulvivirga sedimenti]